MIKRSIALVLLSSFLLASCASEKKARLPKDIEQYINLVAECIKIENMCANDPQLFASELRDLEIPENPKMLVEKLIAQYGRDPKLWHRVYQEIIARSRS